MPKPTIFIGSSIEGLEVARAVQSELDRDAACSVWNQGLFGPGNFTLEVLEQQAAIRDFAILVLTADLQSAREECSSVPRPNVLFELGLFMGRLGRQRVFALHDRENRIDRPSDLFGLTLLEYDSMHPDGLHAAVGPSCRIIREHVRAKGMNAATPLLVDRQNVHSVVGTLGDRLAAAQQEVRVSGFDCKYVILDQRTALESALSRGVNVRIICLDPANALAVSLLPKVRSHYLSDDELRTSMAKIHPILEDWRSRFRENFEFRYLPTLPVVGMFICDPEKDGIMKIELYTHEQRHGDVSRPHLVIPSSISSWRKYFLRQWDLYWECSREPAQEQEADTKLPKKVRRPAAIPPGGPTREKRVGH